MQWIIIHFNGIGTKSGTFDWDYITEISQAASSKSKNANKSAENNNGENNNETNNNGLEQNNNPDSSNNADDGENMLCVIKLTCELGDLSEYKSLMTSLSNKPNITLEFKNKTTIRIYPINMTETN